jgi:hypothetical protein
MFFHLSKSLANFKRDLDHLSCDQLNPVASSKNLDSRIEEDENAERRIQANAFFSH